MLALQFPTDGTVIRRVLAGDHDSFRVIVDRYTRAIRGVALAYLGNAADAEDVVQDTFLRAFQAREKLAGTPNLGAWLVTVAKNRCYDLLRKRNREATVPEGVLAPKAATAHPERDEIYRMLWSEVHQLEPEAREVLLLYYFSRKRIRAIASLLEITPDAAAKRLQRARAALGERIVDTIGREFAAEPKRKDSTQRVMGVLAMHAPGFSGQAASAKTGTLGGLAAFTKPAFVAALLLAGASVFLVAGHRRSAPSTPPEPAVIATEEQSANVPPATDETPAEGAETVAPPENDQAPEAVLGTIHGVVIDEHATPQAGIRVVVRPRDPSSQDEEPPVLADTQSDAEGRFHFDGLRLVGRSTGYLRALEVRAEDGDRLGQIFVEDDPWNRKRFVELPVYRRYGISGVVTDPDGTPVAGAYVAAQSSVDVPTTWTVYGGPGALTDADGRFSLKELLPGACTVSVRKVGFERLESPPYPEGSKDLHLTLQPEGTGVIAGRVVDAATAAGLEGILVTTGKGSDKTDAQGEFVISAVAEGEYSLRLAGGALALAHPPVPVTVAADSRVEGVRLAATPGAVVSGRILLERNGRPLPGSSVYAKKASESYRYPAEADAEGHYRIEGLPSGAYELKLGYRPFPEVSRELEVEVAKTYEHIDLVVEPGHRVAGIVVDSAGAPVQGATVLALSEKHADRFRGVPSSSVTATTGPAGRFALDRYDDEPFRVQAVGAQGISRPQGPFEPEAGDSGDLTLALEAAASISGRVVTPQGSDVPRAIILAVPHDPASLLVFQDPNDPGDIVGIRELSKHLRGVTTATGLSGYFEFPVLLPDTYELHAYRLGSLAEPNKKPRRIPLAAGQTLHEVKLVIPMAGGTVQGRLTVHGQPLVGQKVQVRPGDGRPRVAYWQDWTDHDGKYRIAGIAPGNHELSVVRHVNAAGNKGLRTIEDRFDIADGDALTLDYELAPGTATVTGTVWLNGAPASGLTLFFDIDDRQLSDGETRAQTDHDGRFTATNLWPGVYDLHILRHQQPREGIEGFRRSFRVQAVDNETVEVTFSIAIGGLRGNFTGLREGEEGLVALIPGEVPGDTFTFEDIEKLMPQIADRKELNADGAYLFPDLDPGIYTLFGAAFPAGAEDDEQRFAELRLDKVLVEIEEGQSTEVDINLN